MESGVLMVPGSGPLSFVGHEAFVWLDGDFSKADVKKNELIAYRCPSCGVVELRSQA